MVVACTHDGPTGPTEPAPAMEATPAEPRAAVTNQDDGHRSAGWHTSLTVRSGVVRITYYDRGNGDRKFLARMPLNFPF